ncbi:Bug family tripartite tricarboxylate transporter substrate binding protein [Candidimonas nitroreducens]|uniref:ABC transporter substrate-binding protein n=1 Tax=Candidimonas nitroreducens TaxID=683354 RepID=A0A225MDN0_9BURK|nr:ABC transporter substrate-binding protein [Candidimonas nitroreducens]
MSKFMPSRRAAHKTMLCLAASAAALCLAPAATASPWPDHPIQMVVPFPPGSSPDTLARLIADPLSKALEQPVIVENKPGAGGNIGTRYASKAKPDGYTILLTINGPMVTAPTLYKKTLGYDPTTDLAPITLVGTSPNVLIVPADSPAKSVQDFVAMAKAKPNTLNYGTVGPGSSSHLSMAMLEHQAGISMQQIPYSGFPQVVSAIITGDIQASFMVPGLAVPQISAGKVRALAITSLQPSELLPGIPTMASQGYPGFEAISWDAMFAPGGTPEDIVDRLNQAITQILADPSVKQKMAALYFSAAPSSPDQLTDLMNKDKARWGAVIDRLHLSLD